MTLRGRRVQAALVLAALGAAAAAQDLEPRTYTNIPVGQNFLGLGYFYAEGEITPAPSVPIENVELEMRAAAVAYVRSLDLWGRAGNVTAAWGRVCQKGQGEVNGELVRGDRCGTVDPSLRLAYMFYGAPSMDLAAFRSHPVGRVIGASLKVDMPLGDYNNENVINSGSNRWTFKPELGISNRWGERWSVDGAIAARLFGDNDAFKGGVTLEQDPLYQVQASVIYDLPRGRWLSLNGNYFWGGRTSRDGVRVDDRQENSRVGVSLSWPLNAQHSLKFYANRGVITSIGNDSDTLGVLWQYRWGE